MADEMAEVREGLRDLEGPLGRRGVLRLAAGAALVAAGSAALAACGTPVPGAVATTGGATIDAATAQETKADTMVSAKNGTISLVARGKGIGTGKADDFTYYFMTAKADGTWSCQIQKQGSDSSDKGKAQAGIMARVSGDPGSPFVGVFLTDGNGVQFLWRQNQGDAAESWPMAIAIGVNAPLWLQLKKSGNSWTVAYSQDGKTWANPTTTTINFPSGNFLVGLAAAAASSTQQVDVFSNLSQGFKPSYYLDVNPANASSSSSSK
jgi:regulation of enolase protein 1 (concanavalin A-like superfamily)